MANYTAFRSKHVGTLSAGVADQVTLTGKHKFVEVKHRGTSGDIYFTVDGSAVTIGADETDVVSPCESLIVPSFLDNDVVRLICSVDTSYSVRGIPQ